MDFALSITWGEYVQKAVGLFAIINPFSTIPVFLTLTAGYTPIERNAVARITAIATVVIMLVSYLVGAVILQFLGISLSSFRVAGGILIMMSAMSMLQAQRRITTQTPEEEKEAEDMTQIAIVPLALPLMAGPGSISMAILVSSETSTIVDHASVAAALAAIGILIWIIFRGGARLANRMGTAGINVSTRIMGLLLAALAVQFIVTGLGEIFPGWLAQP